MTRLADGDKAPFFDLTDDEGKAVSLTDYVGKPLVLYFYPADDTPGCTLEACQFSDLYGDFSHLNIDVLGISPDSLSSHEKFKQKYNLKIKLATDPDSTVAKEYGAYGEKNLYGKKSIGIIRSTFLIDGEQNVVKAFYNVRAKGHAEKVLALALGFVGKGSD